MFFRGIAPLVSRSLALASDHESAHIAGSFGLLGEAGAHLLSSPSAVAVLWSCEHAARSGTVAVLTTMTTKGEGYG